MSNTKGSNVDPMFWVRKLVTLGMKRRRNAKIDNLFVTVCGKAAAASRTVIAGWVKSVLRETGIEATPGSFKSAVASRSWLDNEPIDKILAKGNWRSENTFKQFYRKEIRLVDHNKESLRGLFESLT